MLSFPLPWLVRRSSHVDRGTSQEWQSIKPPHALAWITFRVEGTHPLCLFTPTSQTQFSPFFSLAPLILWRLIGSRTPTASEKTGMAWGTPGS